MLNVQQAAEKLGRAPYTIRKFIRNGKIKAVKIGRDWCIKESEIKRILEGGFDGKEIDKGGLKMKFYFVQTMDGEEIEVLAETVEIKGDFIFFKICGDIVAGFRRDSVKHLR